MYVVVLLGLFILSLFKLGFWGTLGLVSVFIILEEMLDA